MADIRIDVRYDGVDRVRESIQQITDAISPPAITEALGKGADQFVSATQDAAPQLSGALRQSIDKVEVSGTEYQIGPRGVVYAAIQNYGGDTRSTRPGGFMGPIPGAGPMYIKHARIKPTNYMDAGFERGLEPATEAVKADVIARIDS